VKTTHQLEEELICRVSGMITKTERSMKRAIADSVWEIVKREFGGESGISFIGSFDPESLGRMAKNGKLFEAMFRSNVVFALDMVRSPGSYFARGESWGVDQIVFVVRELATKERMYQVRA
jgi:hypothetical protein